MVSVLCTKLVLAKYMESRLQCVKNIPDCSLLRVLLMLYKCRKHTARFSYGLLLKGVGVVSFLCDGRDFFPLAEKKEKKTLSEWFKRRSIALCVDFSGMVFAWVSFQCVTPAKWCSLISLCVCTVHAKQAKQTSVVLV